MQPRLRSLPMAGSVTERRALHGRFASRMVVNPALTRKIVLASRQPNHARLSLA